MVFAAPLAVALAAMAATAESAAPNVTLTHSLLKIRPDAVVPAAAAVSAIASARNE